MRKRTARREREREAAKLVRQKQKLAALETGGTPDRPIEVESASVIEPNARAIPCVVCEGSVVIDEHVAENNLRVVRARCARCGNRRDLFYRIARPS